MADLSLQAYVAEIESLLANGAADEASYHARHILGQYPRYTPAFRLLGRALLLKGQQEEAEAAFRRVLSVEPSDISAHLGLSDIYDQRKRGEEAIWHAERAMETEIANAVTTELLRDLYRRYRGEDQPRVALTAVALTRQALHNRDYPLAVATLRDALERHPERVDLRLLLAESLWESGDEVTAAETAADVLEALPDCFSANAILTRLWLKEGRPSDARPFLNRLEALDPYEAIEIASGQPADPDAFTLVVLDYQRTAQADAARAAPDWLQGIHGEVEATATPANWSSGMLAAAGAHNVSDTQPEQQDAPTQMMPSAQVPADMGEADASAFDFDEEPPTLQMPSAALASEMAIAEEADSLDFETLFAEELALSDASAAPFAEGEAEPTPEAPGSATNPLPPLDEIAPRPMPPAEDAMAWLRESGVELVDDEAPAYSTETGHEFPTAGRDDADPMAWLNAYDSVIEDQPAESELEPAATMIFEDGWDFEGGETPAEDVLAAPEAVAESEPDGPQLFEDDEAGAQSEAGVPGGSGELRGLTSRLGDPKLTATGGLAAASAAAAFVPNEHARADEWNAGFDAAPPAANEAADSPDWLTDLGAVMTTEPDAHQAASDEQGEFRPLNEADESAEWLTELSADALPESSAEAAAGEQDWLSESAAIEPELPEWLLEGEEAEPATEAGVKVPADSADVMPDWLMEQAPGASVELAEAGVEAGQAIEGTVGDEEFYWLNTLNADDALPAGEDVDEAVLAAQADVPDWLDNLEAEALAQIDANQQPQADETGESEWEGLIAAEASEALPFDEPAAYDAPVDTEAFEESAESAEDMPLAAAGIAAGGLGIAGMALAVDALNDRATDDTPELAADEWGEPEQADLSRIAPPTVSVEAGTPVSTTDVAPGDWFADAQLAAEAPVPEEGSIAEMPAGDWFTDEALLVPAEAEASAEDWAAQAQPDAQATELGTDTLPYLTAAGLSAASVEGEQGEREEADAGDRQLGAAAFAGMAGLGVLAVASGMDEGDTDAADAAILNAGEDDDEWLMTEWPEDAEGGQFEPDELDALPEAEIVEETVIAPAANAPDWLNAMVPGLDMDYDAAADDADALAYAQDGGSPLDETLGARSEYGWVIDLVDHEELETEAAPAIFAAEAAEAPRFAFTRLPAWFKHSGDDASDDDFADWPSDDDPSLQAWQN
jgi:Flp pilus assembly protein TadD